MMSVPIHHSLADRSRVLAALQTATERATAEQDVYCDKIKALPVPTAETAAAHVARIRQMPEDEILPFFDGYRYPSSWQDRDRLGLRIEGESDPYCFSKRYSAQVADRDIGCSLYHLNERVEHRDRIALLARIQEFMGARLDDLEQVLGQHSHEAECLRSFFIIVFRHKMYEYLAAQGRELGREDDVIRFNELVAITAGFIKMLPQLLSEENCWPVRLAMITETVSAPAGAVTPIKQ